MPRNSGHPSGPPRRNAALSPAGIVRPEALLDGLIPRNARIPTWADGLTPESTSKCGVLLKVPPALKTRWLGAVRRCCALILDHPADASPVTLLLLLPRVARASWAGNGHRSRAKAYLDSYPYISEALADEICAGLETFSAPRRNPDEEEARLSAVRRLIQSGHLRKAARLLLSDGLAALGDDNLATLDRLHPGPEDESDPFGGIDIPRRHSHIDPKALAHLVLSLPTHSAPGPSGWSFAMLRGLVEADGEEGTVMRALSHIVGATVSGRLPAREWVLASRLIAVRKPDGGVRPIAIGESLTRLAAQWCLISMKDEIQGALLPCQFGVGNPGGVEPVIFAIMDAVQARRVEGVFSLDFSNAFNSVSRHRIAEAVQRYLPDLLPLTSYLYRTPSSLIIRTDVDIRVIRSRTGVRQGDPLGPLLFSLAIRPLIEDVFRTLPEAEHEFKGYLDDLSGCGNQDTYRRVVAHFQREDVRVRFGLRLNERKSWFEPLADMVATGARILGSHVGGPLDPTNSGADLVRDAVDRLRERVRKLDGLSTQERLLVLRLCYFPRLVHLIRTMHPDVVRPGCEAFDAEISRSIGDLAGVHLDRISVLISQLPPRMGGLGLLSQAQLSPIAFGAAFVLAQGTLADRRSPISQLTHHAFEQLVHQCASTLNMPDDVLLEARGKALAHLQSRASEALHESSWKAIFDGIQEVRVAPDDLSADRTTSRLRAAFVELGTPLSRPWLSALPIGPHLRASDDVTRYGIRRALLIPHCNFGPDHQCPCGDHLHHLHHTCCLNQGGLRTRRHNVIRTAMTEALKDARFMVREERRNRRPDDDGDARQDVTFWDAGSADPRSVIDVEVCAAWTADQERRLIRWPTEDEVAAGAINEPNRIVLHDFEWEGRDQSPTCAEVYSGRVRRRLCLARLLDARFVEASNRKHIQFAGRRPPEPVTFTPFILSSGGGVGPGARNVIQTAMARFEKVRDRSAFRNNLRQRLSLILLRFEYYSALACTPRDLLVAPNPGL